MKLGIIGNGTLGKATGILGRNTKEIKILCYDIKSELCKPMGTTMEEILTCNMIFICLPTPMGFNGKCQIESIVETVKNIRQQQYKGDIIIRSTVPPATSRSLGCYHLPNFSTRESYESDFKTLNHHIVGINENLPNNIEFKTTIQQLFTQSKSNNAISSDTLEFVSADESEIIKYTRNAFLATKVSFFNEINSYCKRLGVSYETVRKNVCVDNRIGDSHSIVPGPDGKPGFGGKSLMKDLVSFCMSMESANVPPLLLRPVVGRNVRKDRPNEVWHDPVAEVYTKQQLTNFNTTRLKEIATNKKIQYKDPIEKNELIELILNNKDNNDNNNDNNDNKDNNKSRYAHHPSNFPKTNNNLENKPSIGFNSGIQNPF